MSITMHFRHQPCRRFITSNCLPDRAGQPTQIQLHMTLDNLMRLNQASGSPASESGDDTGGNEMARGPAASPGDACDATIVPIVTGNIDHDLLDQHAARLTGPQPNHTYPGQDRETIRDVILATAVALLSGPGHLLSCINNAPSYRPRQMAYRFPSLGRQNRTSRIATATSPPSRQRPPPYLPLPIVITRPACLACQHRKSCRQNVAATSPTSRVLSVVDATIRVGV